MQRIRYIPLEDMDERMQQEMHRCATEGTPCPESTAVRAHVPAAFGFFADASKALFHSGVCDHAIDELCRVHISRTVTREYCGNRRCEQARGTFEAQQYDERLNVARSQQYDDGQKVAVAYAEGHRARVARVGPPSRLGAHSAACCSADHHLHAGHVP